MREIKFRALLDDGKKKWWEYYRTFDQPAWLDFQDVEITIKDLQYTSLKDKNGKEIYEGDIIEIKDGRIYEIYFDNKILGFRMRNSQYKRYNLIIMSYKEKAYVNIIGNIYENPELLKDNNG